MMRFNHRTTVTRLFVWIVICFPRGITCFSYHGVPTPHRHTFRQQQQQQTLLLLHLFPQKDEKDEAAIEEEERLNILEARRDQIRSTLKAAEALRNVRLQNGWVPELDPETGKPVRSDGKLAVTLTAFVVTAGAIALRIGGRAALVSVVGLDFMNDGSNPEIKENLEMVLTSESSLCLECFSGKMISTYSYS